MLAVVILTRNESAFIEACIESVRWADRIVVFDSFSEDDTVARARACGAEVLQHPFENYAAQRNAALEQVEADWIFFVDADERAAPELGEEVREAIRDPRYVGWWVPRRNYLFGRLTRGGGWWPDYQLRVLRRGYARYERPVHEIVVLQGEAGYLRNPLIHHNYDSPAEFRAKQRAYARLEAQALRQAGVRPKPYTPWTMMVREFWRRFVRLRGYIDGLHGLRLAWWMARATWETYRLLQDAARVDDG
jgi:glycosyltransferase involved in cell wall biosynthesis